MATNTEKSSSLPVVSFTSLVNFLNQLRDHGMVPNRVDKSLMPKASGSQQMGMLAALRYLALIDETGKPSKEFTTLVTASDSERKPMLAECIRRSYEFLFSKNGFDLEKGTTGELAEKFRELKISGSTVTKATAFFLAAAKEADIRISPHIRPVATPRSAPNPRRAVKTKEELVATPIQKQDEVDADTHRFEIPIPGKPSVKVIVPSALDADDWEMLQSMITVYIKRWKGFNEQP